MLDTSATSAPDRWVWNRRDLAILTLLVLLAVGVRALVIGRGGVRLDDPDGYLALARSLIREGSFQINGRPTAYRPPLYPLLLAPCVGLRAATGLPVAIGLLHLALGAGTVALVADSARRWGLIRSAVGLAAMVAAVDPVLVAQSRSIMTETLAAFLVAATLWALTLQGRSGAWWGGIGFGLASLCRPSLLPAAILTAGAGLVLGPGRLPNRFGRASLSLAATFLVLSPWAIRNAMSLGSPIWTTTHGGYTLALANNAAYYGDVLDGPPGAVWSGPNQDEWIESINQATEQMDEPEADRVLRRRAIEFAREHPRAFGRASLARLGRFWGVMPSAAVYAAPLRWATAAWTVPLWVLLLVGLASQAT